MYLIRWLVAVVALAVVAVGVVGCFQPAPQKRRLPNRIVIPIRPVLPNRPAPPRPKPCPGPWCPRSLLNGPLSAAVAGRISPDGVPIMCDYPSDKMTENVGGADGVGLCVFDAASWAMEWHGIRDGKEFFVWMQHKPGGGWPEKFDEMMKEYWREKGVDCPGYVQMSGSDTSFVVKALSQGKIVCATYNHSPTGRYNGGRISHMVCIMHHDGQRVAIGDNNYCGADKYEWLTAAEWEKCFLDQNGRGWAIAFDAPPPPPVPHN